MPEHFLLPAPADAAATARAILGAHPHARVFAVHGGLGAGKTTLIKGFCEALGVRDATGSPSFAIVNEYRAGDGEPVYHFDLYRVGSIGELEDVGFSEYVCGGAFCFIEWPGMAGPLLPAGTLHLVLEELADGVRRIRISPP